MEGKVTYKNKVLTECEKLEIEEEKERRINETLYCEICNGPLRRFGCPQLAHGIQKYDRTYKKFGYELVNSKYNTKIVCSLDCNQKAAIGKAGEEKRAKEIIRMFENGTN